MFFAIGIELRYEDTTVFAILHNGSGNIDIAARIAGDTFWMIIMIGRLNWIYPLLCTQIIVLTNIRMCIASVPIMMRERTCTHAAVRCL